MKKLLKKLSLIMLVLCFCTFTLLSIITVIGCSNNTKGIYVTNISKSYSNGLIDIYTITYSNGSTSTFQISNGKDGENIDLNEIYETYLEKNPTTTYEEFLKTILQVNTNGNTTAINKALKSSAKIYTEFTQNYRINPVQTTKETAIYLGSAVVYKIDNDYTYFITNYHVIYNSSASEQDKIAKRIVVYLYGSESEPSSTNTTDSNGCTVFDYGDYGIDCEYVGGSITCDIAIVRAKNTDVEKVNDDVDAIIFADNYHVGETAIAIGNPEGEGLSVTEGIVSVDNEYISLSIDGTERAYRSIRIDTSIYNGSSGGGLFNADGKLIGITNAGDGEDQNVNFAIPVEIVKSAVENIMFYSEKGEKNAKQITLGITVTSNNSKYVYNETSGYGEIVEKVYVNTVTANSISYQLGLASGDEIISIFINDVEYVVNRSFKIGDIIMNIKSGDKISVSYLRDGNNKLTNTYKVVEADLTIIA